jgi:hypothetical protein
MKTSQLRCARALKLLTTLSSAAILAFLTFGAASGAASQSQGHATRPTTRRFLAVASRAVPRPLTVASQRSRRADRNLVAKAKALRKCLAAHPARPSACRAARGALQHAGTEYKRAEDELAGIARADAYRGGAYSSRSSALQAPKLSVSGEKLSWNQVDQVNTYVFVRKVPGQPDQYSTVSGTSTTPPPVPGVTVKYSVRTAVNGSSWASEQSISYPDPTGTTPTAPETTPTAPETTPTAPGSPEPPPSETVDTQAAPKLAVSGLTLSWSPVGNVSTYVLAIVVPGQATKYTEVSGTSITPSAVPGVTVSYSVRTAVDGSAWAPEVSISFPAKSLPPATTPPPQPAPSEPEKTQPGSPLTSPMWVGVDAGGWPSSFASDVAGAASYVRLESPSSIAGWTAAGVKVIDDMAGQSNSGGVSAINATEWAAKAVAAVKANPEIAAIEVLNEPGNQWMGWGSNAGDAANAAAYDHLLKVVHEAMVANFGTHYPPLLASYDGGEGPTTWGEEMWAAEPNVGSYINGITLHSYGGASNRTNSALGSRDHIEEAHAQHPNIPIYVTEVGWPTAVGQPATGDSLQWTEAEQASNITNFITWAKSTDYIADVTIFNYRDYGTNDYYGIETASGAHKLSYAALAAFK